MGRFMNAFDTLADAHWQMWWSLIQRIDPEAKAYAEAAERGLATQDGPVEEEEEASAMLGSLVADYYQQQGGQ